MTPAGTPRRPIADANWSRLIRSTPVCSTTSPVARASRAGPQTRSSTSGARSTCPSSLAPTRRMIRTWIRSAMSPGSMTCSGGSSRRRHGSAVVVDDLDVVPVGVQDERAVVPRVVDGALAGTAVILVAGGKRGGVERLHCGVVPRREREVDVLGERPPVANQREAEVLADQLDVVGLVQADSQPGVRGDRRVEAPGRGRVADADPEVVDAAVRHGVLALRMHRLGAVAVRV